MGLAMQVLCGVLGRKQAAIVRPAVGDELTDAAQRPVGVELAEHVDQVVARADAQRSARLHEGVGSGEALRAVCGAREQKIAATDRDRPFILPMSARP